MASMMKPKVVDFAAACPPGRVTSTKPLGHPAMRITLSGMLKSFVIRQFKVDHPDHRSQGTLCL